MLDAGGVYGLCVVIGIFTVQSRGKLLVDGCSSLSDIFGCLRLLMPRFVEAIDNATGLAMDT